MPDELLGTVKAALDDASNQPLNFVHCSRDFLVINWLRALVARCDQAEADLAALRRRHAEAVEKAYKEGFDHVADALAGFVENPVVATINIDAAWLASEARKAVARDEG